MARSEILGLPVLNSELWPGVCLQVAVLGPVFIEDNLSDLLGRATALASGAHFWSQAMLFKEYGCF